MTGPPSPAPARRAAWRALAWGALALAVLVALIAAWALRELAREPAAIEVQTGRPGAPAAEPLPPLPLLEERSFSDLPGWSAHDPRPALAAFERSCAGGAAPSGVLGEQLRAALIAACAELHGAAPADAAAARTLVERLFRPWQLTDRGNPEGLLTGYYEPELAGSRRRRGSFVHPLYLAPDDRQVIDLGQFRSDLAGRKITGRVERGRFRPYWDRAEIEAGALRGRRLEMLWVDDPVALFFLQIQGSGRVRLPDGEVVRVGYAGQNGHDYTAIGRVLIDRGELTRETVSMQSIRAWLAAHPDQAEEVMNLNRSYVFFRVLPGESPLGAEGVELTAGRSLAVDPAFVPYGLPLWLSSSLPPTPELGRTAEQPLERLVVAQDTGGAIRGVVRGDLFLGPGSEAEATAGRMKQPLRLWLLWPASAPPPAAAGGG